MNSQRQRQDSTHPHNTGNSYPNNYQNIDYSQMSQAERQAEFRRQHQQYIAQKMARKKQILRLRKAQFGSSSSDESGDGDGGNSDSSKSRESGRRKQVRVERERGGYEGQGKEGNRRVQSEIQKIPVNSLKKGGEWVKDVLNFGHNTISLQNTTYDIKNFTKIKIISQPTMGYPYRIKINHQNTQILFSPAVGHNEQKNNLLLNYYVFARIIQQKLQLLGHKLKQPKQQKIPSVPESLTQNTIMHGRLYKKSQVLGNWQQRFIVINKQGIFSYKKYNEKHTMHIYPLSLKEMWTRFEIQDQLLIVKVMYGAKKTQFGLPLTEVLNRGCWLYSFFLVMNVVKK